MGISSFIKKVHDPFGHGEKIKEKVGVNKLKAKLGIDDMEQFESFNLDRMFNMLKDDPERAFLGAFDPLSSKMWGKVTGKDYDPILNQMGGPSKGSFQAAADAGIDIGQSAMSHQIAAAIASFYAGGAGANALGGLSAGSGAGTIGSLGGGAAQTALNTAVPAAITAGASASDAEFDPTAPYDPGQLVYGGSGARGLNQRSFGMGFAEGGHMNYDNEEVNNLVQMMGSVTSVPGGTEMLMSALAEEMTGGQRSEKTKKLRLYNMGGPVEYNEGGLAAAEQVRQMGRGDDDMILHLAPEEYEALTGMWGEPEINPNTGMPEYGFLSKIWKKIKGAVKKIVKSPLFGMIAPIALNIFAPTAGAVLGKALGLGAKAAPIVGDALIRTGVGAATGGKEGALSGAVSALSGSVGSKLGGKLGLSGQAAQVAGDALIGGVGGEIGGGGFAQGALGNALAQGTMRPINAALEDFGTSVFKPGQGDLPDLGVGSTGEMSPVSQPDIFGGGGTPIDMSPIASGTSGAAMTGSQPGMFGRGMDWIKENPGLALGLGTAAYGMMGQSSGYDAQPPGPPPGFNDPLPAFDWTRDRASIDPNAYYTYGQVGAPQQAEAQFFGNNSLGAAVPSGMGQPLPGTSGSQGGGHRGGSGRRSRGAPAPMTPIADYAPSWSEQELGILGMGGSNGIEDPQSVVTRLLQQLQEQVRNNGPRGNAMGGYQQGGGHSKGNGSGRDDTIEALLSDGEYVMDAETVALLGDGSNDEGARRLDEMREELRSHKGAGLAKGQFSDNAKRPMEYMKTGGKIPRQRRARGGRAKNKRTAFAIAEAARNLGER
jgi:hypothetical protein